MHVFLTLEKSSGSCLVGPLFYEFGTHALNLGFEGPDVVFEFPD